MDDIKNAYLHDVKKVRVLRGETEWLPWKDA